MQKTRDELVSAIRALAGETPSDEFLGLMEDVADSVGAAEPDPAQYIARSEYDALDTRWRQRYAERFTVTAGEKDKEDDEKEKEKDPEPERPADIPMFRDEE